MNMNFAQVRRVLLKVFIGFFSLTALIAIVSLLSHEFGETQLKVLATTFSMMAGSICAMSCAAFMERNHARPVGFAGILAACISVVLVIAGVWAEISQETYWKTTVTVTVVAVAFAHGCLLRLPNLAASYRWTQTVAAILIGVLAIQIIVAVCNEISDEGYYRFMAVSAVLVVLATLVVPICSKLAAPEAPQPVSSATGAMPEHLVLQKVSGSIFADTAGRKFQVTEIETEPDVRSV